MKKYFAIFAVLFTVILSSCSNDDIEVIDTSSFQLSISTQSVYDEYRIADSFKERFLGGKGYSIGVFSYIYDAEGNLAASDSTYVDTFGKVTQNFDKLKSGDYTLVTLEMIVENDNDYKSPNWLIAGQEKLETLSIFNEEFVCYWYSAVGLHTSSIKVEKGNMHKEISPEGIGCVIDLYWNNFDMSDYNVLGFFTKDQPVGRYLSSSYNDEERYIYDGYTETNTWVYRGYVYPKSISAEEHITIYLMEEGKIRYCFGSQRTKEDGSLSTFYAWPSSNAIFNVSDGNRYCGGNIYVGGPDNSNSKAGLFDSYSDYSAWKKNIMFDLSSYARPYLNWGGSAKDVNSYMISAGMKFAGSGIDEEMDEFWAEYSNAAGNVAYDYYFDRDQSNLHSLYMFYDSTFFTVSSLQKELMDQFEGGDYDYDFGGYLFWSDETALLLYGEPINGNVVVLYVPNYPDETSKIRKVKKLDFKPKSRK